MFFGKYIILTVSSQDSIPRTETQQAVCAFVARPIWLSTIPEAPTRGAHDPLIVEITRQIVPTLRCFWGHAEVMQQSLELQFGVTNQLLCNQVWFSQTRPFFLSSFLRFVSSWSDAGCVSRWARRPATCLSPLPKLQRPLRTTTAVHAKKRLYKHSQREPHPQEKNEKTRHENRQTTNKRQDQDNQRDRLSRCWHYGYTTLTTSQPTVVALGSAPDIHTACVDKDGLPPAQQPTVASPTSLLT